MILHGNDPSRLSLKAAVALSRPVLRHGSKPGGADLTMSCHLLASATARLNPIWICPPAINGTEFLYFSSLAVMKLMIRF